MSFEFEKKYDIVYSSLTFMHIRNKLNAILKAVDILKDNGLLVIAIDKNQDDHIEYGDRKIKVYPDEPDSISGYLTAAQLSIENQFETEFSVIFVARKKNNSELE